MIWNLWRRIEKLGSLIDTGPRRLRAAKLAPPRLTSQPEMEQKSHSPPPANQPLQTFFFLPPRQCSTVLYGRKVGLLKELCGFKTGGDGNKNAKDLDKKNNKRSASQAINLLKFCSSCGRRWCKA